MRLRKEQILEALNAQLARARASSSDDDVVRSGKIVSVRRAIQKWTGAGEVPFADELLKLGIIIDAESEEPAPDAVSDSTAAEAAPLLEEPVPAAVLEPVPEEPISAPVPEPVLEPSTTPISEAAAGLAAEPVQISVPEEPAAEPAAALGGEPSAMPQVSTAEVGRLLQALSAEIGKVAADERPEAEDMMATRKALRAWDAAGRAGELPFRQELESWHLWPLADPDEEYKPDFEAALALESQGQPQVALQRLLELQTKVSAGLVGPTTEKIAALIAAAQEKSKTFDAQIEEVSEEIQTAPNTAGLKALPAWIEALRAQAETDAYSSSLRERVDELNTLLEQRLAALAGPLQAPSVLLAEGKAKEAYLAACAMLTESKPMVIDTANQAGKGAGAEVYTLEFMRLCWEAWQPLLRAEAAAKLSDTEKQKEIDKELALKLAGEALGMVNDTGLRPSHRESLEDIRQQAECLLAELQGKPVVTAAPPESQPAADPVPSKPRGPAFARLGKKEPAPADEAPAADEGPAELGVVSTLPEEEAIIPGAEGAAPSEELPAVEVVQAESPALEAVDLDLALLPGFDEGMELSRQGKLYPARMKLLELKKAVKGSLVDRVEKELFSISTELEKQTQQRIADIRTLEIGPSPDLEKIRLAWREVLEFNPDTPEARTTLQNLSEMLERERMERELTALLKAGAEAIKNEDLLALEKAYGEAQIWQKRSADERFPDDLVRNVKNALDTITDQRDQLRDKLGVAATLATQGSKREAFKLAREAVEAGRQVLVDSTNVMGKGENALIPTGEFFRWISTTFLKDLRELISRRLEQARTQKTEDPILAQRTLHEARSYITDTVLTDDFRLKLSDLDELITVEIKETEGRIDAYKKAAEIVESAESHEGEAHNAHGRIKLLTQAQNTYSTFPGVTAKLVQAQLDLSLEVAGDLEIAMAKAAAAAANYLYQKALDDLMDARRSAVEAVPDVLADSELAAAIAKLDQRIQQLTITLQEFQDNLQLCQAAEASIVEYDSTQSLQALKTAQEIHDRLVERKFLHPQMDKLHDSLAARRGDPDNWASGQIEYNHRAWRDAQRTLEKISRTFNEYPLVRQMVDRCQAAMDIEKAKELEEQQHWKGALVLYRQGISLFAQSGTDGLTQPLDEDAKEALARLRPIEENASRLSALLGQAQESLRVASALAARRMTPASKTELIPQIGHAVGLLRQVLSEPSTLAEDAQAGIEEARRLWREAYLEGMRSVLGLRNPNSELVKKAVALADGLLQENLLTETDEKLADICLRCLYLDLQFQDWLPHGLTIQLDQAIMDSSQVNWKAIEKNRSDRLSFTKRLTEQTHYSQEEHKLAPGALPSAAKSELLWLDRVYERAASQKQEHILEELRRTSSARLRFEVQNRINRLSGNEMDQAAVLHEAQTYLFEELIHSHWLSGDRSLIQLLMELYWRTKDWERADTVLDLLVGVQPQGELRVFAEVWHQLTRAARAYSEDQLDVGEAVLTNFNQDVSFASFSSLITQKGSDLINGTLNRLISEAQSELRRVEGEQALETGAAEFYLRAARKFALAYQLNPDHPVVINGLNSLGEKLGDVIESLCEQALNIKIQNKQLEEVYRQASGVLSTLTSIALVASSLRLGADLTARVDSATKDLAPKVNRWKQFREKLSSFEKVLENAIHEPRLDLADVENGGWDLQPALRSQQEMQRIARQDTGLLEISTDVRARLDQYMEAANNLADLCQKLMEAIGEENFPDVIRLGQELHDSWQKEQKKDVRWGGLGLLINATYLPWYDRQADSPHDHREIAVILQSNFDLWQQWAKEALSNLAIVNEKDRLLFAHAQLIESTMQDHLSELVDDYSLAEVIMLCEAGIRAANHFTEKLNDRPQSPPESKRAEDQSERVDPRERDQLCAKMARFEELRAAALERKGRLEDGPQSPMARLRMAIQGITQVKRRYKNQPISPQVLQAAEREIKACANLDPLNEELAKYRTYLRESTG